jgi:hypothetical protein
MSDDSEQEERLAAVARAQAQTALRQQRTYWALIAAAVLLFVGAGLAWWQIDLRLRSMDEAHVNALREAAAAEQARGDIQAALRFAVNAERERVHLGITDTSLPPIATVLTSKMLAPAWQVELSGHNSPSLSGAFSRMARALSPAPTTCRHGSGTR